MTDSADTHVPTPETGTPVLVRPPRNRVRPLTAEGLKLRADLLAAQNEASALSVALENAKVRAQRSRLALLVIAPAVGVGGFLVGLAL